MSVFLADRVPTIPHQRLGILAVLMLALGVFVAIRLLVRPGDPLTGTVAVDIAFALFFMARGALYFWTVRRRARDRGDVGWNGNDGRGPIDHGHRERP